MLSQLGGLSSTYLRLVVHSQVIPHTLDTVSAQPSICHAFSRISFLASRLLSTGHQLCSHRGYLCELTDIATCGALGVIFQPVKTMLRRARRICDELQCLSACGSQTQASVRAVQFPRRLKQTMHSPTQVVCPVLTGNSEAQRRHPGRGVVQWGRTQILVLVETTVK
jgi:hypothetical protein